MSTTQTQRNGLGTQKALDERDSEMIRKRLAEHGSSDQPEVGEFVIVDGEYQRVSHVWDWPVAECGEDLRGVQTSHGGSFYLGDGYCAFSGGLNPLIPFSRIALTPEMRPAAYWSFHHDVRTAHNGVEFTAYTRVWKAS